MCNLHTQKYKSAVKNIKIKFKYKILEKFFFIFKHITYNF